MAVVGWEIDQVRKGAGPNGEDVPVPISASYNRTLQYTQTPRSFCYVPLHTNSPETIHPPTTTPHHVYRYSLLCSHSCIYSRVVPGVIYYM